MLFNFLVGIEPSMFIISFPYLSQFICDQGKEWTLLPFFAEREMVRVNSPENIKWIYDKVEFSSAVFI
jgi:hypothetical protein